MYIKDIFGSIVFHNYIGMCTEYGKHLMERNHELQSHIHTLQEIIDEKNEEINVIKR